MYTRTELMIGNEGLAKLKKSHVMIVGLGGVGAYAAEMLCRAGVGRLTLVDGDVVNITNRNRQLIALASTEGKLKAKALADRLRDISHEVDIISIDEYIKNERMLEILNADKYDYIVDAIDTLSPKVDLIVNSVRLNIPIVSSMGSGGKLDPLQIKITDISQSYNCPLAFAVRKKIHREGIYTGFSVVYSPEEVSPSVVREEKGENKRSTVGTISYMPPMFGCMCASVVLRNLIGIEVYPPVKDKRFYAGKKEKQTEIK